MQHATLEFHGLFHNLHTKAVFLVVYIRVTIFFDVVAVFLVVETQQL